MTKDEYMEERPRRRKKKRKSHRLYAFIVILLGIVILLLGFLLLFHVQKIEIRGNDYCSDREIVQAVQNDKYSGNSLYVFGKYALGYGEIVPCMDEMQVRIGFPWMLKIEVKEKPIVGFIYSGESEYAYFDKEGLIVKKDTVYREGVPCVEGIEADDTSLYKSLRSTNSKIFEEILEASQEVNKYDMSVSKIVCKNDRIYIYIGKICASLGNNVTSEKIAQIPPIIEKLEGKEGTLHLESYSENSATITFDNGEFPEEN